MKNMAEHCSNPDHVRQASAERAPAPAGLAREVLAPQSPYAGLGVILVSAMAMMMAMGSSVLVIGARMSQRCSSSAERAQLTLPVAQSWHTSGTRAASDQTPCGTPIYHSHHDGSISVHYRACDPSELGAVSPAQPERFDGAATGSAEPITVQLRRAP